ARREEGSLFPGGRHEGAGGGGGRAPPPGGGGDGDFPSPPLRGGLRLVWAGRVRTAAGGAGAGTDGVAANAVRELVFRLPSPRWGEGSGGEGALSFRETINLTLTPHPSPHPRAD